MLLNLKGELVRKGYEPVQAVSNTLKCTPKTARSKLDGKSDFTVPEALAVIDTFFKNDGFSVAYLFCDTEKTA